MSSFFKKTIMLIIMVTIFMAPISGGIKTNKDNDLAFGIQKNEALAQTDSEKQKNSNLKLKDGEQLIISVPSKGIGYASAIFDITATNLKILTALNEGYKINTAIIDVTAKQPDDKALTTEGKTFDKTKSSDTIRICFGGSVAEDKKSCTSSDATTLKEDNDYKLKVEFFQYVGDQHTQSVTYFWTFRTGNKANNTSGDTTGDVKTYASQDSFGCSVNPTTWFTNCIALFLYQTIFVPISEVTKLAAKILDFFVYYSTNDLSYRSGFVTKAWGAVRDIANIFFIVALLYVAIKTILGLNVTNNKKLIGTIIIVALVINFSLFTTELVIDGSNILAKVFYNNITSVDQSGKALPAGSGGEKSISVGLVKQFNPQDIIGGQNIINNLGQFVLVTFLSIIMLCYMIYIFLSVSLLFVGRVVSLWISMIFSPIAFASYTVPFDIPGFGHKEWWKKLFENAMLAPLFIFFLYIIILFGDFLNLVTYSPATSTSWLDSLMHTIIPFAIIFILLKQAKALAVKYAGEIGAAIMTAGKMVGGLALGAATGGAAMLGTTALGNLASRAASSEGLQNAAKGTGFKGAIAKLGLKTANYGSKATFDVRKIAGVGALAKMGGINLEAAKGIGLGSKEGGYTQRRKEQVEKRQKRAKELEVREDEPLKQALNKTEMDLQGLLSKNTQDIEGLDKLIEKKRQEASDASSKYNAVKDTKGPTETPAELAVRTAAQTALNTANSELQDAKDNKTNLRTGLAYTNHNGTAKAAIGGNINTLETQQKTQTQAIKTENVERRQAEAKRIIKWGGNDIRTDREAAHKIIMEVKLDSGTKT